MVHTIFEAPTLRELQADKNRLPTAKSTKQILIVARKCSRNRMKIENQSLLIT